MVAADHLHPSSPFGRAAAAARLLLFCGIGSEKMSKGGFVRNTVKGRRRGSSYPEEFKLACQLEMLIEDNVNRLAKKHDVPESTLRGWYRQIWQKGAEERKKMLADARTQVMSDVAMRAAGGAKRGVEMINARLEIGQRNAARVEAIEEDLLAYEWDEEDLAALKQEKESRERRVVGDYPLANFTRTLVSVGGMAWRAGGQDDSGAGSVEIAIEVVDAAPTPQLLALMEESNAD